MKIESSNGDWFVLNLKNNWERIALNAGQDASYWVDDIMITTEPDALTLTASIPAAESTVEATDNVVLTFSRGYVIEIQQGTYEGTMAAGTFVAPYTTWRGTDLYAVWQWTTAR